MFDKWPATTEARAPMKAYLSDRLVIEKKAKKLNGLKIDGIQQYQPNDDVLQCPRLFTFKHDTEQSARSRSYLSTQM